MTELPTTKEELERKALEILTQTAERLQAGAIDRRGAHVTAKTVWTLTAGLVDESVSSLAAQLADENPSPGWKRYFIGNEPTKNPLILAVVPGKACVLIKVDPRTGERATLKRRDAEPGVLEEYVAMLVESLKAGGYIEI